MQSTFKLQLHVINGIVAFLHVCPTITNRSRANMQLNRDLMSSNEYGTINIQHQH